MDFFGILYTKDEVVSRDAKLENLDKQLIQTQSDLAARDAALSGVGKDKESLLQELGVLKTSLAQLGALSDEEQAIKKFWEVRHPKATVLYKGDSRTAPGGPIQLSLPVSTWVTPSAFFKNELVKTGLTVEQYLLTNPGLSRLEVYDKLALDIKGLVDHRRSYKTDQAEWGQEEVWLYPVETWFLGVDDCEGFSHLTASLWISAGLPSYRVRCVAGMTNSGVGHNTTYWLARDNQWHHLNSTSNTYQEYDDVVKCPLAGNVQDPLGIIGVWFSYSNENMWQEFESAEDAAAFSEWNKNGRVVLT